MSLRYNNEFKELNISGQASIFTPYK